jgi:hypothetical protein
MTTMDAELGAVCFGLVVGWVTYRTLRRDGSSAHISDIAAVIAAVGGSTVTKVISEELFGWYSMGLAVGFFLYYILSVVVADADISDNKKRELTIGENQRAL